MTLLGRFRNKDEQPDDFKARVEELVRLYRPVGTVDREAACRMVAQVLVRSAGGQGDEAAARRTSAAVGPASPFRRTLARSIATVVEQVRERRLTTPGEIARLIVQTCVGEEGEETYLDGDEIPWLVGTAYGVALELRSATAEPAEHGGSMDAESEQGSSGGSLSPLEQLLAHGLMTYGLTNDEHLVDVLLPLYRAAVEGVPSERRLRQLIFLIGLVEQRTLSVNALMPFIFQDPDSHIIATAALHAVGAWVGTETDPVAGVRELAGLARHCADNGDEPRAAAILAGLVSIGDRRVLECLGPCWRILSDEGRSLLIGRIQRRPYAGLIEWLLSWLEECEGGEFGNVAGCLASIPHLLRPTEVIEVHRALPVWSAPDNVITVLARWPLKTYAQRIRPRLLQIAADEQPPRVMYDVLKEWGIDFTQRLLPGVAMRARALAGPPRCLLPLIGDRWPGGTALTDRFVPLDHQDFLSRDGSLLLSWGIFNPHGPTWSTLGLLPTEDPSWQCLFLRILNPFRQWQGIVGVVRAHDCSSGAVTGRLIESFFARGDIPMAGGERFEPFGNAVPDFLRLHRKDEEFHAAVRRALFVVPRLRQLDVVRAIRELREYKWRPWERVTVQLTEAFARMRPDGLIPPPPQEGETTDAAIEEWLGLVLDQEHMMGELVHFPAAWHGAIDRPGATLASTAFTFWQLDDFLAHFGDPVFRRIAELLATRSDGFG